MILLAFCLLAQDGIDLPVSFEDDVDDAAFKVWRERVEATSALLWTLTEGQVYIATSTIEDKSARGRVVILEGLVDAGILPEKDAMARTLDGGTPAWSILSCGKPDGIPGRTWTLGTVLAHELGHALWNLPDERGEGIECGPCIMGSDPTKLCGPDSHEGGIKTSCKAAIAVFAGLKFPNPAWKGAKVPATKFTIVNRGPKDPVAEAAPYTKDEEKALKDAVGFKLAIGFEGDATPAQLRRWTRVAQGLDRILRTLTENRHFVQSCVVEDRTTTGWIVIEEGAEAAMVLKGGEAMWKPRGAASWTTCGVLSPAPLARYVLAQLLNVRETDACKECPFNLQVWDGSTKWTLCKACLAQLKPAPAKGPLPATRFTITDRQDDGAKLFDEMEAALLKAKSLRVAFDGGTYKGTLLVAEGGKVRYDIEGVAIASDGKTMTVNGREIEPIPGLKESMTRMFARTMAAMSDGPVIRLKLKGNIAELVKVSGAKLGAKKKVGKRDLQELSWTAKTPEGDLAVTVWLDAKTKLPVERRVTMGGTTTTETYSAVDID